MRSYSEAIKVTLITDKSTTYTICHLRLYTIKTRGFYVVKLDGAY